MSVTIKYKGNTIASANTDTTKTLQTSGKYCEADIEVINTQDGGITPTGSITLTEENTYDVTDKATAVVDFSATRANLAEAVTAKGVDTLPTSSFDTIATNIGLISGGGEFVKVGTAETIPNGGGQTYGQLSFDASNGIFLLTNASVTPNNSNRLPWTMICYVDTTTPNQTAAVLGYNYGGSSITANNSSQSAGKVYYNGGSTFRFNTSATYDIYKLY